MDTTKSKTSRSFAQSSAAPRFTRRDFAAVRQGVIFRAEKYPSVPGPTHRATAPSESPSFKSLTIRQGCAASWTIQPRLRPVYHDPELRPHPRLQVYVGFVLLRRFLPHLAEAEIRMRAVLGGMVATHLVVRSPIGRPQVDVFVSIPLHTERNPDETARRGARRGSRLSGQFDLNGAVVKAAALHDRVRLAIRRIGQRVQANRGLAQVSSLRDRTSVGLQLLRRLRAQRCDQQASKQVFHHQVGRPGLRKVLRLAIPLYDRINYLPAEQ